ncbi:hypothetical protein BGZ83_009226 [Gryganskiella cystojenkinii]|nr:hypothetical protein BGZ83_009226 [Gryganskiella cystojenkinii]
MSKNTPLNYNLTSQINSVQSNSDDQLKAQAQSPAQEQLQGQARSALATAASIGGLILSTEAAVADAPRSNRNPQSDIGGGMPDMGGMGGMM